MKKQIYNKETKDLKLKKLQQLLKYEAKLIFLQSVSSCLK